MIFFRQGFRFLAMAGALFLAACAQQRTVSAQEIAAVVRVAAPSKMKVSISPETTGGYPFTNVIVEDPKKSWIYRWVDKAGKKHAENLGNLKLVLHVLDQKDFDGFLGFSVLGPKFLRIGNTRVYAVVGWKDYNKVRYEAIQKLSKSPVDVGNPETPDSNFDGWPTWQRDVRKAIEKIDTKLPQQIHT